MLRIKTPNRRSSKIRTTSPLGKRSKEEERKEVRHLVKRMKEGGEGRNTCRSPHSHDKKRKSQSKKKVEGNYGEAREIMFPPLQNRSSADLVIIRAYMSGRQVNMVYLDGRSSCEVIYEHCFLKLKPSICSLRVDSKVPLSGFSGEKVRFTTQHNTRKNSYAMNGNCSVHHPHSYKIPYTLRNRHRPFPIQPNGTGRRAENNKRRITKGSKRHSQLCRCRRKDSATRTPEGVRRCLRMDHQAHNGSSKNNNNRRRSFQYRAQSKRAQILGTSKAKEKEPDTRKKRSDSYPSRGSYK
ncbi:hypothetical protein Tco_1431948, partial [Tanacetum coccineum]